MNIFFSSIISMAGLGVFFASVLVFANRYLKVEEDPKVGEVEGMLPGINCGACGFPGCRAFAESIVRGESLPGACSAGGGAAGVKIAEFLGIEAGKISKKIAVVHCGADETQRKKKARYAGIQTCEAADTLFWGGLECRFGCLGFGDCLSSCPFNAIEVVNGLPRVDIDRCTACGRCVKACPRHIITLEEFDKRELVFVACNSTEKGPAVKKICPVGCIACKICEEATGKIFEVKDNLAVIDYGKAAAGTDWQAAIEKCPMHTIKRAAAGP